MRVILALLQGGEFRYHEARGENVAALNHRASAISIFSLFRPELNGYINRPSVHSVGIAINGHTRIPANDK